MIVVDPRFTRTAATADLFVQIRTGSDIAFLGGIIRYAIENNRIAKDYLTQYTNAAFVVRKGFKLPEDGLYSGFDATAHTYDKATWNYEEGGDLKGKADTPGDGGPSANPPALPANVAYDLTLEHPRSRVSIAAETFLAIHTGDGRAYHRRSERPIPESRGSVHVHP